MEVYGNEYFIYPRVRTVSSRVIGLILAIILALSFSKWHFQAAFIEHILWFFGWFLWASE